MMKNSGFERENSTQLGLESNVMLLIDGMDGILSWPSSMDKSLRSFVGEDMMRGTFTYVEYFDKKSLCTAQRLYWRLKIAALEDKAEHPGQAPIRQPTYIQCNQAISWELIGDGDEERRGSKRWVSLR